jgi:hypothetical protein
MTLQQCIMALVAFERSEEAYSGDAVDDIVGEHPGSLSELAEKFKEAAYENYGNDNEASPSNRVDQILSRLRARAAN